MSFGFPLYIDLNGNNCTIFGGNEYAADKAEILLRFGARVTVISPQLCDRLAEMDASRLVRYIPRKYYRGDCSTAMLCVAATDDDALNISIASEGKAKNIPVNLESPAAFGSFCFPEAFMTPSVQLSLVGNLPPEQMRKLCVKLGRQMETELQESAEAEPPFQPTH